MAKKVARLSLDRMKQQMKVISLKEKESITGGKVVNIDQEGRVLSTTDEHSGWTYINIVKLDYSAGYNSFKVLQTWSTQREINENKGLGFNSYSGEGVTFDLFKFLSKYTDVEWGMHNNDQYNIIIETTHGKASIRPGYYEGYNGFYHNHQYNPFPSGSDYNGKEYLKKYGYDNFWIYYEQNDSFYYY